jgi:hypothetical protein
MKRWWTSDLSKARAKFHNLNRRAHLLRFLKDHPIHEERRKARNAYSQLVKDTKREHWTQWIEDATEYSIWTINKYTSSSSPPGNCPRLPNLQTPHDRLQPEATSNLAKSHALHAVFFPPPPPLNARQDYRDMTYPTPVTNFRTVTQSQV